ncbi:PIG-L deacetylase family protein [Kineococcus gynurae]|uniref:PIG-L deacetylase family protein n=1 Tax=Kineococcus gynurae TaxID=452979 RepID=A0ABV5LSF1_9ACTN
MPTADDRFVLVAFHAHPDDEALLTGGTLARAAAEGHRVVLVTATDGDAGLAADEPGAGLGRRRVEELMDSAAALGVHRVVRLGHLDSGFAGPGAGGATGTGAGEVFSRLPVEQVAHELAAVLREEGADVLTGYDPAGGYGHVDHVHVHRVAQRAAVLAGTRVLLEATVDRTLIRRGVRLARLVPGFVSDATAHGLGAGFSDRADITHRVDVREHLGAKRAALRAHTSQTETRSARRALRGVGLLGALPRPLADVVLGREWFVERGRRGPVTGDVFASLRRVSDG